MKRLWLFLVLSLVVSVGFAQNGFVETVRGVVLSADPTSELVQASIYVVGSEPAIGTVTDEEGNFTFSVPLEGKSLDLTV